MHTHAHAHTHTQHTHTTHPTRATVPLIPDFADRSTLGPQFSRIKSFRHGKCVVVDLWNSLKYDFYRLVSTHRAGFSKNWWKSITKRRKISIKIPQTWGLGVQAPPPRFQKKGTRGREIRRKGKKWQRGRKNEENKRKRAKNEEKRPKMGKLIKFGRKLWILDLKIQNFFENSGTRGPKFVLQANKPQISTPC